MRAADDFAVIRARLHELERDREWTPHNPERGIRGDELDRMDFRAVQHMKDAMKAKIIARNRFG